jgi:hypothetical protein
MSQGETFYLRALLAHHPAWSFIELQTVNGELYTSFQSACLALGIFADETEANIVYIKPYKHCKPHMKSTSSSLIFLQITAFLHLFIFGKNTMNNSLPII